MKRRCKKQKLSILATLASLALSCSTGKETRRNTVESLVSLKKTVILMPTYTNFQDREQGLNLYSETLKTLHKRGFTVRASGSDIERVQEERNLQHTDIIAENTRVPVQENTAKINMIAGTMIYREDLPAQERSRCGVRIVLNALDGQPMVKEIDESGFCYDLEYIIERSLGKLERQLNTFEVMKYKKADQAKKVCLEGALPLGSEMNFNVPIDMEITEDLILAARAFDKNVYDSTCDGTYNTGDRVEGQIVYVDINNPKGSKLWLCSLEGKLDEEYTPELYLKKEQCVAFSIQAKTIISSKILLEMVEEYCKSSKTYQEKKACEQFNQFNLNNYNDWAF